MSQPDTSALEDAVARLDRESARFLTRSAEVYEALARASATARDQYVELTVAPNGSVSGIVFLSSPTSHTALTTAVGRLYRQAAAVANEAVAGAVPEVADGVREAGRPAAGDEADRADDARPTGPTAELDEGAGWQPTRSPASSQGPALNALDRLVAEVDSAHDLGSLRSAFDHPEVAPTMPGGQPDLWQRDLERRIAAVGSAGASAVEAMGRVRGEAGSSTVTVAVSATGALQTASFHLAARGADPERLAEEFMQTYGEASAAAAEQLTALLSGLDVTPEAVGGGGRPPAEEA